MLKFNPSELAALHERLQEVAAKLGKKAVRSAARKAMKPVRDQVQATAPEDLPPPDDIKIKNSVGLTTKWKGSNLYVKVGIKGGARRNPDTPWYWRQVEFGNKFMPARPFMRPALEGNAQKVLDAVAAELRKALFKK